MGFLVVKCTSVSSVSIFRKTVMPCLQSHMPHHAQGYLNSLRKKSQKKRKA
jgi:hypothetical protein